MPVKTGESKTFVGIRGRDVARVWVQTRSTMFPLPPHNDVRDHSPDGFEWGYGGRGPAQLALALCLEGLPAGPALEARALRGFQDVKWRFVGAINGDSWQLDAADVLEFIEERERFYAASDARALEQEADRLELERRHGRHEDARVRQALGEVLPGEEEPT